MPNYVVTPAAQKELWDIWLYVAQNNQASATRLVEAAHQAFRRLSEMPQIGKPQRFTQRSLKDVRSWPIPNFGSYVIFYSPIPSGILVHHVFHTARDLERLWGN